MRTAVVFLVLLLLSACAEGTYGSPTDGRLATRIERSYAARDACLARNAGADDISNSDPATLARAIALACAPETQKLVEVSNRDGDPRAAYLVYNPEEGYLIFYRLPYDVGKAQDKIRRAGLPPLLAERLAAGR